MGPSGRARAATYDTRRRHPTLVTVASEARGSMASSANKAHRFEDFDTFDTESSDHSKDGDSPMVDQAEKKMQANPDGGQKKKTKRQMDARPSTKKREAKNHELETEVRPGRKEDQASGKKPVAQARDDGVAQRSGKKIKTDAFCSNEAELAVLETPVKPNDDGVEHKKTIKKLSTQKSTVQHDSVAAGRSLCVNETSSTEVRTSTKNARSSKEMPKTTEQLHDLATQIPASASTSVRCLGGQANFDYCDEEDMGALIKNENENNEGALYIPSDVDEDEGYQAENRQRFRPTAAKALNQAVKQEPKQPQIFPSQTTTSNPRSCHSSIGDRDIETDSHRSRSEATTSTPRVTGSYHSSSGDAYSCGQSTCIYGLTQLPHASHEDISADNVPTEPFGAQNAPNNRDISMSQGKNIPGKAVVTQSVQTETPYPSAASLARNR
jgi:hypothetical protein